MLAVLAVLVVSLPAITTVTQCVLPVVMTLVLLLVTLDAKMLVLVVMQLAQILVLVVMADVKREKVLVQGVRVAASDVLVVILVLVVFMDTNAIKNLVCCFPGKAIAFCVEYRHYAPFSLSTTN